ncbi:MAG: hypothetical protein H0T42_03005 [Deltaproteobacteria bacterium]|nr:hypothetical protein [Deltaproteobacteria bacterium]
MAETINTPESELPPSAAMSHQYRWLVIAGGMICLASMWLPMFGRGEGAFVPMKDEYGQVAWLWLLIPGCAVQRTERGMRWLNMGMRLLLVLAGLAGAIALVILGGYAIGVVPAPLAVVLIGAFGRGVARLIILIATTTLIACALMFDEYAAVGLAVLAFGSAVLLIGAVLWSRRPFQGEPLAPLPRAVVR